MSLIGQEYKQPRVFAHDAWPVVIGAINYTWNTSTKFPGPLNWGGIRVTNAGTGYEVDMEITLTGGGVAKITVTAVDGGAITDYTVSTVGKGYAVGNNLTQSGASVPGGGTGFTCTVTNIDIPNTQEAGCCLYFSPVAAAAINIDVIMEAGKYDGSIGDGYPTTDIKTFKLVPPGIFLPILVKQVINGIDSVGNILALY